MSRKCDLPLHGLTVVIDTAGPRVYIGRFDHEDEQGILLMDADVRDLESVEAKVPYVRKSAKFGVWKNTDRIKVPHSEVVSLRRLSEIEAE
ncbi:MAG: hypothetical protein IT349_07195 [Candidatus Eisenbacteria bacterium]|nr:hypothetical protein [Candidatus Eisenbacteria bacterium]